MARVRDQGEGVVKEKEREILEREERLQEAVRRSEQLQKEAAAKEVADARP